MEKLTPLFKEWSCRVVFPAVRFRVPLIRPPYILAVNNMRRIRMIKRDNIVARESAWALVKHSLPLPTQPSYHPAPRAPRRRRNFHHLVERKIVGFNGELGFTILTILRF